jgi:dUTPase
MAKAVYTGWWTGVRVLFGGYLPYSDGEIEKGRRRIGRGVTGEGVWPDVLEDKSHDLGMRVTTRLNWYKSFEWDTDVFDTLVDLMGHAGNSSTTTNDHTRGDKEAYLHVSMRAMRAGLCLKDLARVATVGSAGVDVRAVGVKQVMPSEEDRAELFDRIDPLYFDTVLLRKGAEYHMYTGLVADILPKWSLQIVPKSSQTDWEVVYGLVDSDYEGEIRVRIVPKRDIRLNKLDSWVGQLVPIYTGASINIVPCDRKRLDDGFGAADLPSTTRRL